MVLFFGVQVKCLQDGTDYNIGDSFIIDGKIAKISEIN